MATRPRKGAPLTAGFVAAVQRPGAYGDGYGGKGLVLRVKRSKYGLISKNWVQRIRIKGEATNVGLGAYPAVSLRDARLAADKQWREIKAGRDPRGAGVPTLEAVTDSVISLHRPSWRNGRTEKQWRAGFALHLGALLDKRIDLVTAGDLLSVLGPMVHEKPAMCDQLRGRLNMVMEFAVAQKMRTDNPVDVLAATLPRSRKRTTHHKSLHHSDVRGALDTVGGSRAATATKLAVKFLALTATRTSEVRLAEWGEIDLAAKLWTIPAERMKADREHRVPLSGAALDVLAEAAVLWGSSGLVFCGRGGGAIGHSSFGTLFKRLEIGGTPHGLRSSFRNWCSETGVPAAVAERALAHVVKGAVEAAYHTTDLLEARRAVMDDWGSYIGG